MKNLRVYFCLVFCHVVAPTWGNQIFFDACDAYGSQDYPKAIMLLESTPPHSFARYFNLGCAYLQNHDPHRAWVAFEKARQLKPYDQNLKRAFQMLSLKPEQRRFIPIHQTTFVMNLLTAVACIFFGLTLVFWIRRRLKKSIRGSMLYLSLLGGLGCLGTLYASSQIFRKCIVVRDDAVIHIAPTIQSEPVQNLPAGTPLIAATKYGNFLHIHLKNGRSGWINGTDVCYILE